MWLLPLLHAALGGSTVPEETPQSVARRPRQGAERVVPERSRGVRMLRRGRREPRMGPPAPAPVPAPVRILPGPYPREWWRLSSRQIQTNTRRRTNCRHCCQTPPPPLLCLRVRVRVRVRRRIPPPPQMRLLPLPPPGLWRRRPAPGGWKEEEPHSVPAVEARGRGRRKGGGQAPALVPQNVHVLLLRSSLLPLLLLLLLLRLLFCSPPAPSNTPSAASLHPPPCLFPWAERFAPRSPPQVERTTEGGHNDNPT